MAIQTIKMPDVGEGVAEAEIVEWHVKPGDLVREDDVLTAVMTGKATVEIPSPLEGKIVWIGPAIGDMVPVGTPILKIEHAGEGEDDTAQEPAIAPDAATDKPAAAPQPAASSKAEPVPVEKPAPDRLPTSRPVAAETSAPVARPAHAPGAPRPEGEKPLASPAVRLRAREAGIDLRQVPGTGPAGRITHEDLELFLAEGPAVPQTGGLKPDLSVKEIRMAGLRRRIAEQMSRSKSRIPHITYVDEVDMTALEELRAGMNRSLKQGRVKLTLLPFLMRAMVKAIADQPLFNAIYDDEAGIIRQHGGVHIGIAAQTPSGLMVPVVRHAEARDIHDCAREILRLSEAARTGTALREELSGSTITISSLGALGGIVSTPVINHPEVAIIGVNKMAVRPHWDGTQFVPRKMMNLSSSFDHRVIDGYDAATFIQRIKALLENPAMIFVED